MRLVRLGWLMWDVIAIAEDNGHSVREELEAIDPGYRHAETMRVLLSESVPRNGPPAHNSLRCGPLGDDIFEFKAGPERGKKLRVLWFYDEGRLVVCTHSFMKDRRKTPPDEKARAILMRRTYFDAKRRKTLPPIEG
jgi:phage-related protein